VPLHNLRADEKAETAAGNRADRAGAESSLEHVRPRLHGDPDAAIANLDARLGRRRAQLDVDRAAVG